MIIICSIFTILRKTLIKICNKYDIEPFRKIKECDLKKKINEKWLDQYKGLITGSTMKYYKNKVIPKINRGLNITNGGEYWLKAKAGALRLNNIHHMECTRCDTHTEETLEHFLWKCPNNVQHYTVREKFKDFWENLPNTSMNNNNKGNMPNQTSDEYITDITEWLLDDNVPGLYAQRLGHLIYSLLKIRPETINNRTINNPNRNEVYQHINEAINIVIQRANTYNNGINIINPGITGNVNPGNPENPRNPGNQDDVQQPEVHRAQGIPRNLLDQETLDIIHNVAQILGTWIINQNRRSTDHDPG